MGDFLDIAESEPNVIALFMLISYKPLDLREACLAEDKVHSGCRKSLSFMARGGLPRLCCPTEQLQTLIPTYC